MSGVSAVNRHIDLKETPHVTQQSGSKQGTRIEFRNITKVFKNKKTETKALDSVSLTVEPC